MRNMQNGRAISLAPMLGDLEIFLTTVLQLNSKILKEAGLGFGHILCLTREAAGCHK